MKKIITYGTFDLLHWGHVRLLERAKELGDHLTVALSTDEFNLLKHKEAYHSFEHRKYILEAIKYVDEVIPKLIGSKKQQILIYTILIFLLWVTIGQVNLIFLKINARLFILTVQTGYQQRRSRKI